MATERKPPQEEANDPYAHERGFGKGIDNVEDPQGEYRNEGYGQEKGWHKGGDYGAGLAANIGRSAGEIALEDSADANQKAKENKESQETGKGAGSQKSEPNEAPGSNTSSTSTGVVSDPDKK